MGRVSWVTLCHHRLLMRGRQEEECVTVAPKVRVVCCDDGGRGHGPRDAGTSPTDTWLQPSETDL